MTKGGHNKISREDLLQGLVRFAEQVGETPTRTQMSEEGPYSGSAYNREFGSWNGAIECAGLTPNHEPDKEPPEQTCVWCGGSFSRHDSQLEKQKNQFCSRECKRDWQSKNKQGENHPQYNRVEVECAWCGNTLKRKPSLVETRERLYCDYDCMGEWRAENTSGENSPRWMGGRVTLECQYCGDAFKVKRAKADKSAFCSYDCMGAWKKETGDVSGPNNPNWRGGYGPYYGPNWSKQRRWRREEDDYRCQDCGMADEDSLDQFGAELSVHHIQPVRQFMSDSGLNHESANDLENLVTLCMKCHAKWEGTGLRPENSK